MSEDIREEIAKAWVEFTHTKPEDANEWWFHDGERLADALMPLVARIQAAAWAEGWVAGIRDSKRAAAIALGAPKTPNPYRADRLEQGDPQ